MDKLIITPVIGAQSVNDLVAMANDVWPDHFKSLAKVSADMVPGLIQVVKGDYIRGVMQIGALYYFIADIKQERIGYFGVIPDKDGIILNAIYLVPEYRRKSYGRRILRLIEKVSKSKGLLTLGLMWPFIDHKAISFLKFNKYKIESKRIEANTEFCVMSKQWQ